MGQSSLLCHATGFQCAVSDIHGLCQHHNPWMSPSSVLSPKLFHLKSTPLTSFIMWVNVVTVITVLEPAVFELSTDSQIIEYSLKCGTSDVIMEPVSLFLSHYDTLGYDRKPINGLKELQTLLLPLQCFKPTRQKLNRHCLFFFDKLERSESYWVLQTRPRSILLRM